MIAAVHTTVAVLVVAVFLAAAVEMVEALTIVVAVGVTQGWRTALSGAAAAVVALAVLVAALGPALLAIPLGVLRLVVGGLLLVFGLQWLRKAVLRSAGLKAKHDENAIFAEQVAALQGASVDRIGFVVAFKGVFLEGLEVVVVVLTLGTTTHDVGGAALAATAAVVLVGVVGAVVARQLAGVPENALKMAVGLMLVSYGTFWVGEAATVHWPGSDAAILGLVAIYAALSWVFVRLLARTQRLAAPVTTAPVTTAEVSGG
jgi:uncharacterized membrane protein